MGLDEEDQLLCCVTPPYALHPIYLIIINGSTRELLAPDDVSKLYFVRDELLGPKELRTAQKAVYEQGVWTGGVAWERDDLAYNVNNAPRCYTLGPSFQVPKSLSAPSPGAKTVNGILTSHQLLRKDLIEVILFNAK